jgi:alanine dehydrogenase
MPEVPVYDYETVLAAVAPLDAIERVRDGFVRYESGEWGMPPKVYLAVPPAGDFRAMPAKGGGLAILKWVTSFPGNPARGLPVVMGMICVSSAETGEPLALIDVRAVTALRTGAVFTSGVCFDVDPEAAGALAGELGWEAGAREDALACDIVTCVTPGHEPVVAAADLHPGVHLNMLGADGPGKAEAELDAIERCRLFCDEWAQASHGGELTGAAKDGRVTRDDVTELGAVLTGKAEGRTAPDDMTLFDSTGLAIQDLALCHALLEAGAKVPTIRL